MEKQIESVLGLVFCLLLVAAALITFWRNIRGKHDDKQDDFPDIDMLD